MGWYGVHRPGARPRRSESLVRRSATLIGAGAAVGVGLTLLAFPPNSTRVDWTPGETAGLPSLPPSDVDVHEEVDRRSGSVRSSLSPAPVPASAGTGPESAGAPEPPAAPTPTPSPREDSSSEEDVTPEQRRPDRDGQQELSPDSSSDRQDTVPTRVSLVARHSNHCADVFGGWTNDGVHLIQYLCVDGRKNQQFDLMEVGDDYVQLRARHSGKCVDILDQSTADQALLVQQPCGSGTSQQFKLQDLGNGYHSLVVRHSGKCVDVVSHSSWSGAELIQWICHLDHNQQWRVVVQ